MRKRELEQKIWEHEARINTLERMLRGLQRDRDKFLGDTRPPLREEGTFRHEKGIFDRLLDYLGIEYVEEEKKGFRKVRKRKK